jgi:hypothetical protein
MNIFGMPIFAGYYTIHNPVDGTVGFAPHPTSKKESIRLGSIPSKTRFIQVGGPSEQELSVSAFAISWGICAVLMVVVLSFLNRNYSERMKR